MNDVLTVKTGVQHSSQICMQKSRLIDVDVAMATCHISGVIWCG